MEGGGYMRKQDTLLLMIAVSGEMPADLAEHIIGLYPIPLRLLPG